MVKNILRMLFFSEKGLNFYWLKVKICSLLQKYDQSSDLDHGLEGD